VEDRVRSVVRCRGGEQTTKPSLSLTGRLQFDPQSPPSKYSNDDGGGGSGGGGGDGDGKRQGLRERGTAAFN